MKKESGLKKTWQRFTKRAASLILAGAVAISILPMAVSAADETVSTKFWQTIVDLNMDGFEALRAEGVEHDTATVDGRTYGADFTKGTNGKRNGNSRAKKNGEDEEVSAAYTKGAPDGVGDYVLKHHGAWVTNKWTSSDSGWAFSNLWDASTVKVGDTVKISAQVYPLKSSMFKQTYRDNFGYEPAGAASDTGAMRLVSGTHSSLTDVTGDQWNKLNLEFAITADDVASGGVTVDSGAPAVGAVYAYRWMIGSVKVEVLTEPGGSYTLQSGKKWEQLSQVTVDDYEAIGEGIGGGYSYWHGKKTDNTGWLNAGAGNGKYGEFKTNTNAQRIHQGTGISEIKYESAITSAPVIPGEESITKVFKLNRGYSNQTGSWNGGAGKGAPDSYINISGLFDKTKVQVGDTVKITAWVMGSALQSAETAADTTGLDVPTTVTMWLSSAKNADPVTANGPAAEYNFTKPTNASETASYHDMMQGVWKEISLTYTVTEENKDVTGISLNSDKFGSDKVAAFPLYLYLAGVKAEKQVDDPTQTVGTVAGTISAKIDDATDTKIVVAAYKGNELLGCDIVDADAATTKYSFSIADAYGTDKVIAYIWKLDNANPVLAPIPLTAN